MLNSAYCSFLSTDYGMFEMFGIIRISFGVSSCGTTVPRSPHGLADPEGGGALP